MKLPTEAQWERAAQGKSKIYHQYPWGDQPPDGKIANSGYSGLGHASPVGMFPDDCTDEEVMDMGGNVWEWCRDWYQGDYYQQSPEEDPKGPEKGESRVIRGGSWVNNITWNFRCAYRDYILPDDRGFGLGFRVVCSAQF
ncbi:MAG: SUMF1/EgtB/PvdO family nonheme iron enzyme [Candidatus Aminicenantes bacterium]|nr:SUMF1/EgtB/PvdO family nonheme iron enzyme [Candidatus Aminicenantes bacterium]